MKSWWRSNLSSDLDLWTTLNKVTFTHRHDVDRCHFLRTYTIFHHDTIIFDILLQLKSWCYDDIIRPWIDVKWTSAPSSDLSKTLWSNIMNFSCLQNSTKVDEKKLIFDFKTRLPTDTKRWEMNSSGTQKKSISYGHILGSAYHGMPSKWVNAGHTV